MKQVNSDVNKCPGNNVGNTPDNENNSSNKSIENSNTNTVDNVNESPVILSSSPSTNTLVPQKINENTSVLNWNQIKKLDELLNSTIPIHGRANFPTINVKLRDFIQNLHKRLIKQRICVRGVRINGGVASNILSEDHNYEYSDIDIIYSCNLLQLDNSENDLTKSNYSSNTIESSFSLCCDIIKQTVLDCLLEYYPNSKNEKIPWQNLKDVYVKKMTKIFQPSTSSSFGASSSSSSSMSDMQSVPLSSSYNSKEAINDDLNSSTVSRWSLISLCNNEGKNIELKFVDKMKRQFQFSVDAFQIHLDSLLQYYECQDSSKQEENSKEVSLSENFFPSVLAESMYGNFKEAMFHLNNKLIATKSPEEIRGGGLLKYCNLLIRGYKPVSDDAKMRSAEKYMCSRFFIDFSDLKEQEHKLHTYMDSHFQNDSFMCVLYLNRLYEVVNKSTVCLMGHERKQTLNLIETLAHEFEIKLKNKSKFSMNARTNDQKAAEESSNAKSLNSKKSRQKNNNLDETKDIECESNESQYNHSMNGYGQTLDEFNQRNSSFSNCTEESVLPDAKNAYRDSCKFCNNVIGENYFVITQMNQSNLFCNYCFDGLCESGQYAYFNNNFYGQSPYNNSSRHLSNKRYYHHKDNHASNKPNKDAYKRGKTEKRKKEALNLNVNSTNEQESLDCIKIPSIKLEYLANELSLYSPVSSTSLSSSTSVSPSPSISPLPSPSSSTTHSRIPSPTRSFKVNQSNKHIKSSNVTFQLEPFIPSKSPSPPLSESAQFQIFKEVNGLVQIGDQRLSESGNKIDFKSDNNEYAKSKNEKLASSMSSSSIFQCKLPPTMFSHIEVFDNCFCPPNLPDILLYNINNNKYQRPYEFSKSNKFNGQTQMLASVNTITENESLNKNLNIKLID